MGKGRRREKRQRGEGKGTRKKYTEYRMNEASFSLLTSIGLRKLIR